MSPPGDIRAYDVVTGKRVWQFHTVPLPGEFGYETWPKDAWKYVGGANTWGEMSIDEARGIVYLPTGSGTYDFYGGDRIGANLFANCLLALDARTGKRLWHFQTLHHDLWDFDNVSAPQLVTVQARRQERRRRRAGGKDRLPLRLQSRDGRADLADRRAARAADRHPGRAVVADAAVPDGRLPPFGRQKFTRRRRQSVAAVAGSSSPTCASASPKMRNEGLFTPPSLRETVSMPGNQGGSNWGTTAANPEKGIVYVLNIDAVAILKLDDTRTKVGGFQGGGRRRRRARCTSSTARPATARTWRIR